MQWGDRSNSQREVFSIQRTLLCITKAGRSDWGVNFRTKAGRAILLSDPESGDRWERRERRGDSMKNLGITERRSRVGKKKILEGESVFAQGIYSDVRQQIDKLL